jgi:hypothetical protein
MRDRRERTAPPACATAHRARNAFRLPCCAFRAPKPPAHAASVPPPPPKPPPFAAEATAVPAAASATSECWWRKCKRRTERTGDETTKELVGHANSSCRIASMNTTATDAVAREDDQQTQTDQRFQMTNVTVSDTEVSLMASRAKSPRRRPRSWIGPVGNREPGRNA